MTNCTYCGQAYEGRSYNHDCQTTNLPRARRRDGKYALRRHEGEGHVLWVDITKGEMKGISYQVGHVMDPENFEYAVDVAEEESRVLMAQAAAEFGS